MTVCCYHVKYAFQSESTLYSCLKVKEFLAWNVTNSVLESSRNSLLTTQFNHLPILVKWLSIPLWTKWLRVRFQLQLLEIIWTYIITTLLNTKLYIFSHKEPKKQRKAGTNFDLLLRWKCTIRWFMKTYLRRPIKILQFPTRGST